MQGDPLTQWLERLGLSAYIEAIKSNNIDFDVLPDLTEHDLAQLGIKLGDRKRMMRAIAELVQMAAPGVMAKPSAGTIADAGAVGAANGSASSYAERRHLTFLFADLVGSTALSTRHDPEEMLQIINAYQQCSRDVIRRFDGHLARYIGDGILAYFGYPHAREDDAERATRAGIDLIEAIKHLKPYSNLTLQTRVGIASGLVVVSGQTGDELGLEEIAVGDAPNLAARLQTLADPDTVVIGERTQRLIEGLFEYADLGLRSLKGFDLPIRAWRVIGPSDAEGRFGAKHKAGLSPLVGRNQELALLTARWDSAKSGEGQVVLLTGEAGIGKSHLMQALREQVQTEPHVQLSLSCSPYYANTALYPIIDHLTRAAGFRSDDPPYEKLSKLERILGQTSDRLDQVAAILAALCSIPTDGRYPPLDLTPQQQKRRTFEILLSEWEGMTRKGPVLMTLEDAHWIDPSSKELFDQVVDRVGTLPVLLIVSFRSEFMPSWTHHAHVTLLKLNRLTRAQGTSLITQLIGTKALPEALHEQILSKTDGVPLFLEELTKAVLESELLKDAGDRFELARSISDMAIPETLQDSLMARLDKLSQAGAKEVAQIGAVIGREFSYELLSAVAGIPKDKLDESLEQLMRSELIFRRSVNPHAVYTFKHALVRDAAYEGLLKSRRAQLHAALANAFEQIFPEIVEAQPEIVAHHLTEAGVAEKAVRYWLRAGTKAAQRSAHLEAIAHLQKGLDALHSLPSGPERVRTELDLVMAMGPCLIATQGPAGSDAIAIFTRARQLCERLGDPPEYLQVMFWLVTANVMRGELPLAQETIAVLLDRTEQRGDRPALLNAMRGKAMILMFMGQIDEAARVIAHAFDTFNNSSDEDRLAARAAGQDAGVADLALMSWTLWLLGKPDSAAKCVEAALQRADAIGHPHTQAYARYYASVLYALRGQFTIARTHAERCLELSEAHGFRHWHGVSRTMKGICATLIDASSSSLDDVRAALDEYRSAGYQLGITVLYVLLCSVLLLRDDFEGASDILDQGLLTVDNNSERIFEAELYRLKALTLQRVATPDAVARAEDLLERAFQVARNQQAKSLELRVACDLAQTRLRQNKPEEAREILAPVYDYFTEGGETKDLCDARALLAEL